MAGDWIKMRGNLWDDPRVAKLCDLTDQGEAAVVGALYWLWATADQHTEDGCMPGLTLRQINRKTGIQGFGEALCEIGWLKDDPQGVVIVKFEEHNGSSAKRRCYDAQRKANVRSVSASNADNLGTCRRHDAAESGRSVELEKEKRREEESSSLRSEDKPPRKRAAPVPAPGDVEAQVWSDWCELRKGHSAKVSATAVDEARKEAAKAGLSLEAFLRVWCVRGSRGLQADWLKPHERAGPSLAPSKQSALESRNAATAARILENLHAAG